MQFGCHCLLNIVPGLWGINHCMQICVVFFSLTGVVIFNLYGLKMPFTF
jgi:hypothetical protein